MSSLSLTLDGIEQMPKDEPGPAEAGTGPGV